MSPNKNITKPLITKKELDKYSDIIILTSLIQIHENEFKTGFKDGHGVEDVGMPVENADAIWAVHFVTREGVEIRTQRLHINGAMWYCLGAIDEDGNVLGFG